MNPNQKAAAHSPQPWNIVLAGPGSGKTKVVVERAKHLVANGVPSSALCFVTFTNIAAKVLKRRLAETVGAVGFVGTLHAMMLTALRRHDPMWTLVSEDDADEFIERHAELLAYRGSRDDLCEARRSHGLVARGHPAVRVIASYRQFMLEEKLLDYDMVLSEGLRLLTTNRTLFPWTHWFVDEFQDSGVVDAAIYLRARPEGLFICADADQSIFAFRGARPQNVGVFWNDGRFAHHFLTLNYRSSASICEVANEVIALNTDRIEKTTESAGGVVEPSDVLVGMAQNEAEERASVGKLVMRWIANGLAPSEVAVLCRTNKLVREMTEALKARGIPVAETESEAKPKDWRLLNLIIAQIATPSSWAIARLMVREQARLSKTDAAEAEKRLEEVRARGEVTPAEMWGFPPLSVILGNNAQFARFGVSRPTHEMLARRIRLFAPTTIEELQEALHASPEAKHSRGVNVLTVHAAKGEEFDAVAIVGTDQFVAPVQSEMEEERRLFFVAVTRAKRYLAVFAAAERTLVIPVSNRVVTAKSKPSELFKVVERIVSTPSAVVA